MGSEMRSFCLLTTVHKVIVDCAKSRRETNPSELVSSKMTLVYSVEDCRAIKHSSFCTVRIDSSAEMLQIMLLFSFKKDELVCGY